MSDPTLPASLPKLMHPVAVPLDAAVLDAVVEAQRKAVEQLL